jgi:3-deoxy-manno-octulosonate cytidylyltransferase (CMP-KDO synthetase)
MSSNPQSEIRNPKSGKVLAVIPARYASTRFPGKSLFPIAGVSLLRRVWERCRKARTIDRLVIATDDARIWRASAQMGADVVLTSKDHLSGTDRVAEVARTTRDFAYIINIQGDEPLIDPRMIDALVRLLKSKPQIGMVTAAHPFSRPADVSCPHQVKVTIDKSGRALNFSRQPIPGHPPAKTAGKSKRGKSVFFRHQGIYGFRRKTLLDFVRWKTSLREQAEDLEQLRALENGVTVHVLVTKEGSPGVDTPEDAAALEKIIARADKKGVSR